MPRASHPSPDPELLPWLQLAFDCGAEQIDAATELLERFGATAVSITPLQTHIFESIPGPVQYGTANRVAALLAAGTDLDILIACLRNRVGAANVQNAAFEAIKDRNWTAEYRAAHGALLFGNRLCICPSWAEPAPVDHVVFLDPGLAFGTGTHATTALCLEWLARTELNSLEVIDYGCGSGVLALSAAALGARAVLALDIDPAAVEVAAENVAKNAQGNVVSTGLCGAARPAAADILVANILLQPLLELAPTFSTLVRPHGRIALSGILATQAAECAAAYRDGFDLAPPEFRDEWALLHGVRRAAPDRLNAAKA